MSASTLHASNDPASGSSDDPQAATARGSADVIAAAVRTAWRTVVGRRGASGGLTLEEAGCDSLCLLQFALALERELGRPLPLELIDTEMRADEIVAALSRPPSAPVAEDQRPTVFLMPGLDDDEQRLARFRVALQPHVRFILAKYPDWPDMICPGWGMPDLVEYVMPQVLEHFDGRPILLTGYSFGGEVGFAVASRLLALGRTVRWFGILDADITSLPPPPSGGPIARIQRYLREMNEDVHREGLHKTAGLVLGKFARQVVGLPRMQHAVPWLRLLPLRTEFWFHRRIRSVLRMYALWAWMDHGKPQRLNAPVTLFASQAGEGVSPPHRGWGPLCPNLTIVRVTGDHHTLFDPPHREVLYARYAEVLQAVARG